jgi:ATP-dependent Clp protease protease subunit
MNIEKQQKVLIKSLEEHHYLLFNKEFDKSSTGDAIRFILERNLMATNRPDKIKMIINSEGGELPSAFALVDTMKGSSIPIHTYGLGQIASCGLIAFISGEKGKRFITQNTSILSHQFFWGNIGKEHELMSTMKEINNTSLRVIEHYKKCTGLNEKDIKKYLLPAEDVWLTAKEAVKYGIADEIVSFY